MATVVYVIITVIVASISWVLGFNKGFALGKADVLDRIEATTGREIEEGGVPEELDETPLS